MLAVMSGLGGFGLVTPQLRDARLPPSRRDRWGNPCGEVGEFGLARRHVMTVAETISSSADAEAFQEVVETRAALTLHG